MLRSGTHCEESSTTLLRALGVAIRASMTVAVVLFVYGCSTQQPLAGSATPPGATAGLVSAPVANNAARPGHIEEHDIDPAHRADAVFFALRSAHVDSEGVALLRKHADRLKQNRKSIVTLVGYSDGSGCRSYNLAITEERLAAVSALLRKYGVTARQIRRNRGYSVRTQADCQSTECQKKMRRVELVYAS